MLFINNLQASQFPKPEIIEEHEKFLEKRTKQKVIVLPPGCCADIIHFDDETIYIIKQDIHVAVEKEQQDRIAEKIKEKVGLDVIFLLPGTTLDYIA